MWLPGSHRQWYAYSFEGSIHSRTVCRRGRHDRESSGQLMGLSSTSKCAEYSSLVSVFKHELYALWVGKFRNASAWNMLCRDIIQLIGKVDNGSERSEAKWSRYRNEINNGWASIYVLAWVTNLLSDRAGAAGFSIKLEPMVVYCVRMHATRENQGRLSSQSTPYHWLCDIDRQEHSPNENKFLGHVAVRNVERSS